MFEPPESHQVNGVNVTCDSVNESPLLRTPPQTHYQNNNRRPNRGRQFRGNVYQRLGPNQDSSYNKNRRNYNRKRPIDLDYSDDIKKTRANWSNNDQPQNKPPSAQNRINSIRNHQDDIPIIINNEPQPSFHEDSEPTDFTVQIVNTAATTQESQGPTRFKMVLDPKTQEAIQTIQAKRKDKQVVYPFPVKPNTTEISLHERFTML